MKMRNNRFYLSSIIGFIVGCVFILLGIILILTDNDNLTGHILLVIGTAIAAIVNIALMIKSIIDLKKLTK